MITETALLRRAKLCRTALQTLFLGLAAGLATLIVSTVLEPAATGAWLAASFGYPVWPMSAGLSLGFVAVVVAIGATWLVALAQLSCTFDPEGWKSLAPDAPARGASRATLWVFIALSLSIVGQVPLSCLATWNATPGERIIAIGLAPAHLMGLIAVIVVGFLAVVLRLMADLIAEQREIV